MMNFDVWLKCNMLSVNLQKTFGNQSLNQANLTKFLGVYVQGHPTTVFYEISVRRSKGCLEFSMAREQLKFSICPAVAVSNIYDFRKLSPYFAYDSRDTGTFWYYEQFRASIF